MTSIVSSSDGQLDSLAITTWQYRTKLRASSDQASDKTCRYCPAKTSECGCYGNLEVGWEHPHGGQTNSLCGMGWLGMHCSGH